MHVAGSVEENPTRHYDGREYNVRLLISLGFSRWDISVIVSLRHFGHWNISVICTIAVSKLAITLFISLYFTIES